MACLCRGDSSGSAICDSLLVSANIHVVRDCLSTRSPAKDYIPGHICCPGSGVRLYCMDRYMEEANLTETISVKDASPVAVSCKPDVLCC